MPTMKELRDANRRLAEIEKIIAIMKTKNTSLEQEDDSFWEEFREKMMVEATDDDLAETLRNFGD